MCSLLENGGFTTPGECPPASFGIDIPRRLRYNIDVYLSFNLIKYKEASDGIEGDTEARHEA
jgi:hypothetical protein